MMTNENDAQPTPDHIDFAHADFAMHCDGGIFHISCDRGKTWSGPYKLRDLKFWISYDNHRTWEGPYTRQNSLSARTDYIIDGPNDCLLFLSANLEEAGNDRAFAVQTQDGGRSLEFLSWITRMSPVERLRLVMPSTVRISETQLLSALRRRKESQRRDAPVIRENWIDVYASHDNGKKWEFLSEVADTDRGRRNGNPPSMVRLKDGRLCVTYSYRSQPYGMRAKVSNDNGETWGPEIHLRDDGRNWDLGYTRTVQRPDHKLVTIYYHTTTENPEQHIVATIWDPDRTVETGGSQSAP